ncbi:MAG: isochorismate synthase [Actinomycetota bacterium]
MPDLLAYLQCEAFFFEQDGSGVVGNGIAALIEIEPGPGQVARASAQGRALLEGIEGEAIIVGALPFDSRSPATLLVPEVAIRRRNGVAQALIVGDASLPSPSWSVREPHGEITRIPDDPNLYLKAVSSAIDRIRSGSLDKVVLARTMRALCTEPLDVRSLLDRLRKADHHAFAFSTGGPRPLVGASPELAVSRHGAIVRATPLAGSAPRSDDPAQDAAAARSLVESRKDRNEHDYVVRAVMDSLSDRCSSIERAPNPTLLATSRVWHLSTPIHGVLKHPYPTVLELAALMHPTPAVCGTPPQSALDVIRELESFDRGLYAGITGWMDSNGDGEWAIALRCATINGNEARLYAGSGIVEGSDPAAELAETESKFEVLLNAMC